MTLQGENIEIIRKTEGLIDASKKVGLEINIAKTMYMSVYHHQNAHSVHINSKQIIQNVSQFKYLETTITNQNLTQEEIKRRVNSGNVCYHSNQNLPSSHYLMKNIKIRQYKSL
jgi:hypothetical protein